MVLIPIMTMQLLMSVAVRSAICLVSMATAGAFCICAMCLAFYCIGRLPTHTDAEKNEECDDYTRDSDEGPNVTVHRLAKTMDGDGDD